MKTRSVRFVGVLLFILLMGMSVVGEAAKQTLTVYVLEFMEPGRQYYQEVVKPAFEKENPDLEVEFIWGAWTGRWDRLTVLYAGGTPPDVMQFGAEDLGQLLYNNWAAPIDAFAQKWGQLKDYPAPAIEDCRFGGKLYGIPYNLDIRTLTYRRDLFAEAGLDPQKTPATWEELVEYGRRLTKRDAQGEIQTAGLFVGGNGWQLFAPFFYQAGGTLFSPDFKQTLVNQAPGREALQFLVDAVHEFGIATSRNIGNLMAGKVAMAYHGFWVMSFNDLVTSDDVGVAMPTKRVKQAGLMHVNKWVVLNTHKDPANGWKWIEFVSRPDILAGLARANNQVPPRLSVAMRNAPWSEDPRWMVFYNSAQLNPAIPGHVATRDLLTEIHTQMPAALKGEKPPVQILDEVARIVNQKLAEYEAKRAK